MWIYCYFEIKAWIVSVKLLTKMRLNNTWHHSMIYDILQIFRLNVFKMNKFYGSANFVYTYYLRWIWLFSSMKNCRVHLNEKSKNEQKMKDHISLCSFFKGEDNKNYCYQVGDFFLLRCLWFNRNCILQFFFTWRCIFGCWWMQKINVYLYIWHIIAEKGYLQLKPQ